jgi:hypothetical protein
MDDSETDRDVYLAWLRIEDKRASKDWVPLRPSPEDEAMIVDPDRVVAFEGKSLFLVYSFCGLLLAKS